jgi:GNAT superfamily N-acetyltransferase
MRVVLSFGANDTALDNGRPRLALEQSLANACTLLRETRAHHAALLIGPPPVADAAHDERIGALSRELAGVAAQESVPYLDVFTPLQASALWRQEVIANDGSHPRSGGYRELATLVMSWSAWWFHQPHSSTPQQGQAGPVIRAAETDREIDACFPVMKQLRPQLVRSEFVTRVRRQMADGYRLACLIEGGTTRCVAGYRLGENLAWGRFLYVDDLVTGESSRSHGHGRAMLAWLLERAREAGCQQLHLDSGMQRTGAHRFYVREGLDATSLHFARRL